jgi:hypothetical protein
MIVYSAMASLTTVLIGFSVVRPQQWLVDTA